MRFGYSILYYNRHGQHLYRRSLNGASHLRIAVMRRAATGRHSSDNSGITFDGGLTHFDAAASR